MKHMAVLDKGGLISNIIVCEDNFPEVPNERVDITDSPWLRIGDPIDLEAPEALSETVESRKAEFSYLLDNLDKQQVRPLATLYVLAKEGTGATSPEDEDILYRTEMQKQAYRNLYDVLMTTPIKDWNSLVEAEYVRLTTPVVVE